MRLKLKTLWHLRPRLLTVALVAIVGGMIVLANLTDEFGRSGDVFGKNGEVRFSLRGARPVDAKNDAFSALILSYGWPLRWRQFVRVDHAMAARSYGMTYSAVRFAADLVMWFVMLATLAALCEWRMRHRRRFQWSLRTMLAGIAVVAALCGWFVAARKQADTQDAILAIEGSQIWVTRWKLPWLEVLGAERYGRTIVGARLSLWPNFTRMLATTRKLETDDEEDRTRKKEIVARLARLRDLQYLFIDVDDHHHDLVDALRDMRRLKVLSLDMKWDSAKGRQLSHDLMTVVGGMSELEHLSLDAPPCWGEDLACLAGLVNLKSLRLTVLRRTGSCGPPDAQWLSRLPPLPRLETVDLSSSYVGHRGLRYLAVLPRLKRLNLNWLDFVDHNRDDPPASIFDLGFADLACLEHLEEVSAFGYMACVNGLEALLALKHLKKLHFAGNYYNEPRPFLTFDDGKRLSVYEDEFDRYRRALKALRQANPDFAIDGDHRALDWPGWAFIPAECERIPNPSLRATVLDALRSWQQQVEAGVPAAARR